MLGRPLSQKVTPIVIATWQNFVYAAMAIGIGILFNTLDFGTFSHPSLVFLSRPCGVAGGLRCGTAAGPWRARGPAP